MIIIINYNRSRWKVLAHKLFPMIFRWIHKELLCFYYFLLFIFIIAMYVCTKPMFFSAEVYDVSVRTCGCVRVYELNVARRFVDIAYVFRKRVRRVQFPPACVDMTKLRICTSAMRILYIAYAFSLAFIITLTNDWHRNLLYNINIWLLWLASSPLNETSLVMLCT